MITWCEKVFHCSYWVECDFCVEEQREEEKKMGDKVVVATADLVQLMTIPGVGSKRAAAIIQLRESEDQFTMQALVTCTNMKQNEWAKLHQEGVIELDLPSEELQIPGVNVEATLSPSSRKLTDEFVGSEGDGV